MQASRRMFLGGATAASYSRILGANSRPRIGVVGTGPRGQYLMRVSKKALEAEFPAICDIYDVRRAEGAAIAGNQAKQYVDYRQLLGHNDIDGVIVATPDHWHTTVAVDACKAGKDVFIEKPMAHYPKDGQAIVKAARDHGRIVQVGTQGRTMLQNVDALELYLKPGHMGKVGMARTWYTSNQGYVRTAPPGMEKKPAGLDWDRWLGPGPKIPWNPDIYFSPYKWLHYDGGMIMGIGIHVVDTAHYLLDLRAPKAATAGGGVYFYKDGRDTPDTVALIIEYPDLTVTFTAEALTAPGVPTRAGVELRGTGGTLSAERYVTKEALQYTPNSRFSKLPAAKRDGTPGTSEPLLRNWVECMASRRKPVANEVEAYYSTVACFMGNQAFRTRSRVVWDNRWNLPA